jgi:hypothetical protein
MLHGFTTDLSIYLYNKRELIGSLVGDHLPERDFGPYGIIFMNVSVVITVVMVIAVKGFWAL